MDWGALLLVFVSLFAGVKLTIIAREEESFKFSGLAIASFLLMVTQLCIFLQSVTDSFIELLGQVTEWGHILSIAFILSALAVFIRDSKPVFAQFPLAYTALPVLIVLSYFMVIDTYALKSWLISIYQGGAIVVGLLMYSVYWYRREIYMLAFSGVVLMLLAYIIYWFIPVINESYPWVWQLVLAAGIVTMITGYDKLFELSKSNRRASLE